MIRAHILPMFLRNIAIKGELQRIAKVVETVGNKGKAAISGGFQSVEMRGIEPRSDDRTSVFYVRSLLAVRRFFCPHRCRRQLMASISTVKVPCRPCGSAGKASLLNDAQHPQRRGGVNGAAAHWLILARSSGSESELSAVRFSTYSFVGGIHERTLRSRHASCDEQVTVETDHPQILNYQTFRLYSQKFQDTTVYPTNQIMLSAIHHTDETSQNR